MTENISVVIPAYNRGEFIEKCVNSVFAQTVLPEEIIIIDDGSQDKTAEIIKNLQKKYPVIKYIHQPNAGSAVARSAGLIASKNNIIAFLDSDDLWKPIHLEESLKALEMYPDACFTFADVDVTSTKHNSSDKFIQDYCARRGFVKQNPKLIKQVIDDKFFLLNGEYLRHLILLKHDFIATSNVVVHRKRINAHIFFDNILRIGQDIDFILQYLKMGADAVYIDSVHSIYVIHDKNIVMLTGNTRKNFISSAEVKKLKIYTQSMEKRLLYCTQLDEYEHTFKVLSDYYWYIAMGLNDNQQYKEADLYFRLSYKCNNRWNTLKHIIAYKILGEKGKAFLMRLISKLRK